MRIPRKFYRNFDEKSLTEVREFIVERTWGGPENLFLLKSSISMFFKLFMLLGNPPYNRLEASDSLKRSVMTSSYVINASNFEMSRDRVPFFAIFFWNSWKFLMCHLRWNFIEISKKIRSRDHSLSRFPILLGIVPVRLLLFSNSSIILWQLPMEIGIVPYNWLWFSLKFESFGIVSKISGI